MREDPWDPAQYSRFAAERAQPFRDLLALVQPRPGMRVADLGCGTGELTLRLHEELRARETVGLDSSAAMLAQAAAAAGTQETQPQLSGVRFEQGDIAEFAPAEPFDLIFSNATLHWLPDHGSLLRRLTAALAPGGQIAVQIPANEGHPSHQTARELAEEDEFRRALGGIRRPEVVDPARYASWLYRLGFGAQHVRLQVYLHLLPSREDVVEWVKGALLTEYERRLPQELYARFLLRYRERLLPRLEDARPFPYTYPRLLFWGEL